MPAIGGLHRLPRLGAHSSVVVAGKLLLQLFFIDFGHSNFLAFHDSCGVIRSVASLVFFE
jgi:hypothetical protein